MSQASITARMNRRRFISTGSLTLGGLALTAPLAALQAHQASGRGPTPEHGYGPLFATADDTTGLPLLRLPRGFHYKSFGWSGDVMSDGTLTPDRHDGMAVVDARWHRRHGGELVLIRNHERFVSPGAGFPAIEGSGRSGPFLQGEAQGGAIFARGEGCWYHDGTIYFVDTSAGPVGKGIVWALRPRGRHLHDHDCLTALFVSQSEEAADNPDNITVSPRGGILVCEDGGGQVIDGMRTFGTRLIGIGKKGSFPFAENNIVIDQPIAEKPLIRPNDYRGSEFCGATFSPSGDVLFVNIQSPGITLAIEGPWRAGVL